MSVRILVGSTVLCAAAAVCVVPAAMGQPIDPSRADGPAMAILDPGQDLRRAVDLDAGGDPAALDALAIALASDRRFDEAAQAAQRAADLADRQGRDKLAGQIRGRLALYRRGVPFVLGR